MALRTLNKNNSAVKRIMQEARELANDPSTDYSAAPLEDDIFEWHCTIRGPKDTEFEGGLYHFRILLPAEYPFRPPSIMMLTPSGRFELNTKICISFTSYHEELWQPAWGVRTAIIGLQGFFPLRGTDAVGVGSLETTSAERRRLAGLSREWHCEACGKRNVESLPDPEAADNTATDGDGTYSHSLGHGHRLGGQETRTEPATTMRAEEPAPVTVTAAEPAPVSSATERTVEQRSAGVALASEPPAPLPVPMPPHMPAATQAASSASVAVPPSGRPLLLLDTAICVFIVLILSLLAKRVL